MERIFEKAAEAMRRLAATPVDISPQHLSQKLAAEARLGALAQTELMDTSPEVEFDRITRLIKTLMHVDVTLISLVDTQRQFFKSQCGLPPPVSDQRGTPLSHSFCQYVVATEEALVVPDATVHNVLKTNGAVFDLNVIAYLGVPIRSADGQVLGSLCAIETKPRDWTAADREALEDFAHLVENAIQMRSFTLEAFASAARSDILAREYNHRVKNTMAIASSLVRLTRRETSDIDVFAGALQTRFTAMKNAHNLLAYNGGDVALGLIVQSLLKPYTTGPSHIHIEGPEVMLAPQQVVPLCLLLHEFATNSAKYGAIGNDRDLSVSWRTQDRRIVLDWAEQTQKAPVSEDLTGGFGSRLLTIATQQLQGHLDTRWASDSLRYVLTIPWLRPGS